MLLKTELIQNRDGSLYYETINQDKEETFLQVEKETYLHRDWYWQAHLKANRNWRPVTNRGRGSDNLVVKASDKYNGFFPAISLAASEKAVDEGGRHRIVWGWGSYQYPGQIR